jgi:hypothetical protein
MAKVDTTFSFSIAERGETSGQAFNWAFTAKRMLSIRDRITKDSIRRQLIGDNPQNAEQNTVLRAEMLATLQVSLIESPKAWKESNNGLDLFDDNVLIVMYEKIMEEQSKAMEEAEKNGEAAKEQLRKVARSKKVEEEAEPKE